MPLALSYFLSYRGENYFLMSEEAKKLDYGKPPMSLLPGAALDDQPFGTSR